ncbi:ArsR/SmtB family transcription factor [Halomicrococcus gelatinilyticus]|uniref:ArsR/SmtB family transcription factor n=1 Tax=Halomicrococcus gelatinilyticus TaxID=1702103 RepID=UPI002E11583E
MADLLPSSSDADPTQDGNPRVLGVDSEDADDLLGALSSGTARTLLSELHDDPATPSQLSDRVDTSLQNVQYHLGNLEEADLVESVDTVYSEKGREMTVYAPTDQPLVLFAGREEETTGLKDALSRVLGIAVLLGAVSAAVQYAFDAGLLALGPETEAATDAGDAGGADGGQVGIMSTDAETTTTTAQAADGAADALFSSLPPGLLFFAGGALVLALGAAWWYVRNR